MSRKRSHRRSSEEQPAPRLAPVSSSERRRGLWRAFGLVAAVILLSPLKPTPLGPFPLVGIPAALALIAFQARRSASLMLAVGLLAVSALGFQNANELWYVGTGWSVLLGGGLVAASALYPGLSVFERSMLGVALAVVGASALVVAGPASLANLDWRIAGQYDAAIASFDLEGQNGAALAELMRQGADIAKALYPAWLLLASLAALACALYVERRMAGDEAPLGPLREFRFSDHLVWALVIGLVLLVLPVGVWSVRTGGNLVTVMAGLYVLRGAAVLAWLGTSVVNSGWAIAFWIVAALLLYPVTLGTAFVMGLSDTWLDLRSRLRVETEGE